MPRPNSRYIYDKKSRRYRDASGRFVSGREVRQALDTALQSASSRIRKLGAGLRENKISLTRFELEMRVAIKDVHLYSRALARGGWDRMTPSDFGSVGQVVKKQYAYLSRFVAEISLGYPFDGRFTVRVGMYAQAARHTFYAALTDEMESAGMTEEQNVLTPAEHCAGCLEETELGWVPIGTLVPVGERICITNCKCYIEYRS